jgi:hypothetical protein
MAMVMAAILGGPIAGSTLVALNFRRLHVPGPEAMITLAAGLVATVILVLLPTSRGMSLGLSAAAAGILAALVDRFQGSMITMHRERGGRMASRWAAVGIALILAVAQLAAIYLLIVAGILN